VAAGLRSPFTVKSHHLWHDLVPGEGWFVDAKFIDDGGDQTSIPADRVSHGLVGSGWKKVVVDVTGLPEARGTVQVTVDVVDRMRGGLALGGANQTCVCTRAWWRDQSEAKQECTIIHEFGHKVYMVTDGTGQLPDKVDTHYENKGHVGNHCYKGCADGLDNYNTTANKNASQCVMFGTVNEKNAFCDNCGKAVKKMDIGGGW